MGDETGVKGIARVSLAATVKAMWGDWWMGDWGGHEGNGDNGEGGEAGEQQGGQ